MRLLLFILILVSYSVANAQYSSSRIVELEEIDSRTADSIVHSFPSISFNNFFESSRSNKVPYVAYDDPMTVTYDTVIGGWYAIITRHKDHWAMDSTQLIVFSPGLGEEGFNYDKLRLYGIHKEMINTGWDGGVPLADYIYYPVYVSLQEPNDNTTTNNVRPKIDILLDVFKIRRNGARGPGLPDVHLTGISQGGQYSVKFPLYMANSTDSSYAKMINSMWIVQGVDAEFSGKGAQPLSWPTYYGWWSKNFRGRLVYLWNNGDAERKSGTYIKAMNDSMPGSAVQIKTNFGLANCGHCRFQDGYNINRTWASGADIIHTKWFNTAGEETTPQTSLNQTWAQWLIRNGDTTISGVNRLPVVSAGFGQEITLPTNSVNLDGSATDADGTITSYLWEKISGPDTYTFGDNTDPTTTFSGLVAGTYELRLTATDNDGGTSSATTTVTVNAEPGNEPPTVNAGGDISITLPTSSVSLEGVASDADGTISSYTWTKVSGGTATIESPSAATTVISGLSQGGYVFRLTVEDNEGSTAFDDVLVTVSGAPGANKVINIAFVKTVGFYKNPEWNNFNVDGNVLSGVTSQQFNYSDGSPSSIYLTMNRQVATNDNGANYTGFAGIPDSVIRYASTHNPGRNVTLFGLDNAKPYNLSIVSTRNSAGPVTIFTVGGVSDTVATGGNKSELATFTNVTPTNGQIVINISNGPGSGYNYINAIMLTEIGSEADNQLPVSDPGDNQVITLPTSSVTLNGTGSNDPDGTIASYEWTQVSGPATATIETPAADQTVVSSLTHGTYIFQLKVTDNEGGESINQVQVRVNTEENEIPIVNAGNDTVTSVQSYTLRGSAFDWDGTIVSHTWTLYMGTGASITNPGSYETSVSGLEAGEYQFVLTAIDNSGAAGTDTIKVTVIEPPVFNCKADAGLDQVLPVGTPDAELLGKAGSFGDGDETYAWRCITTVDQDWKAKIKQFDSANATVQILPFKDGGYNFELTVTDTTGCVSKDTVNVTIAWGAMPPQGTNSNGWRRATAADTVAMNAQHGVGYAKINDVIIDGANTGTVAAGKLDINLFNVSGLTITPGQKIFIKGGHYRSIRMSFAAGQVAGSAAQPIILTNYDGQVRAQSFTIVNIKNVKMTGRYVEGVSGHKDFKGHADGAYAWSRGKYGFCLDAEWSSLGGISLRVAGTTTDSCEFEYIEAGNGNFTGMMFKNDNTTETWRNFRIHDCYIYSPDGEGVYLGSTGADPQNMMENWKFYNNRIVNAGNEIFQFGQIGTGTDIYNNVFVNSAKRFKSAFSRFQSFGVQLNIRAGNVKFRDNINIGFRESMYNFFYGSKTGASVGNDTVYVQNNLHLYGTGRYGGYMSDGSNPISGQVVKVTDNFYGQFDFRGDEYYTGAEAVNTSTVIRTDVATPKFYSRNNVIDGSGGKTTFMTGTGLDSAGNTIASIEYPAFVNGGMPAGFNWNYFEEWTDSVYISFGDEYANQVGVNTGAPVTYDSGHYVTRFGKTYRSLQDNNHAHVPKGRSDEWWELITWTGPGGQTYYYPPEDYRLVDGSYYELRGMGLQETGGTVPRTPVIRIKKHGKLRFTPPES
jgi:hypothetical protein